MSARALKALLGTVGGLLILWLVISFLPRGTGRPGGSSQELAAFFQGVTPESVSAIRIQGPDENGRVELTRSEGQWKVNGFRTDSANLARFWEAVEGAEIGDLVATNPANHPRMGLTADSAWTFELELASGPRTLLVGNPGSQYGTSFVRLPEQDNVHVLEGDLRPQVTRNLDAWRNKRVSTLDTAAVQRIEVEREYGAFVLQRSDSLWTLEGGEEADPTAVSGILGEMARMDASGFYAPGDSLPDRAGVVRALDAGGGVRLTLEIGAGEGDRWARAAGDSITYRIPSWRVSRIFPDLERVRGGGG